MSSVNIKEAAASDAAKPRAPTGRSWTFKLFIAWPIYMLILTAIGIGGTLIHYTLAFPDPAALRQRQQTQLIRIVARDGSLLAKRGKSNDFISLNLLPKHVIEAVLATEDRRFFDHWGIDPLGLIRASFVNMRAGRYIQGGSTLTQQLAKNLFLTPQRTLSRKFEEVLIALWLEVRLSKQQILELYLNRVYFGGGAYGIEAAAQRYFDKSATSLTIGEAAMIAGLLKAPSRYSPRANPGLARRRARTVMRKMYTAGFISRSQYHAVKDRSLRFAHERKSRTETAMQYAIDFALERLPTLTNGRNVELIVETTIDPALQRYAQTALTTLLNREGRRARAGQAAFVLMDRRGRIAALVGGRSHAKSQYNRATTARRQPGSAFKIFVYLAALEAGMTPDEMAYDQPINIRGWQPRNAGGRYRGPVTLRSALTHSINTVAAQLQQNVGTHQVIEIAHRLGIKSKLQSSPSLSLGTAEVSLLELTGAYGVLANGGYKIQPHIIRRVITGDGRVLYAQRAIKGGRIVSRKNIGAMNDMLNAVLVSGTGKRAAIKGHPAAGKTGTTQQFRDAWFVGYSAHYVAGVWVGNDANKSMRRVTGGGLPARLWRKIMTRAHRGKKITPLPGTRLLPPHRPRRQPIMPKERIGEDFIARMISGGQVPIDTGANTAATPQRSRANAASALTSGTAGATWWASGVTSLKRLFGMAPQPGLQPVPQPARQAHALPQVNLPKDTSPKNTLSKDYVALGALPNTATINQ